MATFALGSDGGTNSVPSLKESLDDPKANVAVGTGDQNFVVGYNGRHSGWWGVRYFEVVDSAPISLHPPSLIYLALNTKEALVYGIGKHI